MEFIAAKCPNCSGELRLPDDKNQVKCMYCGFDIIVREAINAAGVSVENLLKLAITAEQNSNYQKAYDYFTKVLEFEADNYIALAGKGINEGINAGYLSTPDNFRADELKKGVESAVENVPDEKNKKLNCR